MSSPIVIRLRRNTAAGWAAKNPILAIGEPAYERDTGRFKIGDGQTPWLDLAYFIPSNGSQLLQDAASIKAAVLDHVNAEAPHPVYDDGPSLALIYQNAKV